MYLNLINKRSIKLLSLLFALVLSAVIIAQEEEEVEGAVFEKISEYIPSDISTLRAVIAQYEEEKGSSPSDLSVLLSQGYLSKGWTSLEVFGIDYELNIDKNGVVSVSPVLPSYDDFVINLARMNPEQISNFTVGIPIKSSAYVAKYADNDGKDDKITGLFELTTDEKYLDAVRHFREISREANNRLYLGIPEKDDESDVAFITDLNGFEFDAEKTNFEGEVQGSFFYDQDDVTFSLNLENTSSLNRLGIDGLQGSDGSQFNTDMPETSQWSGLNLSQLDVQQASLENANIMVINGSPGVNLGQLPAFAVTQAIAGNNIFIGNNGQVVNVGSVEISIVPDPVFDTLVVNNKATVGLNLVVEGNATVQSDLVVQGDSVLSGDALIDGALQVSGNIVFGNSASDALIINELARFSSTFLIEGDSALGFVRSEEVVATSQINSPEVGTLSITSDADLTFESGLIGLTASDRITLKSTDINFNVSSSLDVNGDLDIGQNLTVMKSAVIGQDSTSRLFVNSAIDVTNPLRFQPSTSSAQYTLGLSIGGPGADLILPSISGQFLVVEETTLEVNAPKNVAVAGGLNIEGKANFQQQLSTQSLMVSTAGTPLTVMSQEYGEVISFSADGGLSNMGLRYGEVDPEDDGVIGNQGDLYVNRGAVPDLNISLGGNRWALVVREGPEGLDDKLLYQNGSQFGVAVDVGTLDDFPVRIITAGETGLEIGSDQSVNTSKSLSVGGVLNVTEDAQFKSDLLVNQNTEFLNALSIGDDAAIDTLSIFAQLANDIVLLNDNGNRQALELVWPSTPSSLNIQMPSLTGSLVAYDATSLKTTLPKDLDVAANLIVNGSTTIAGVTTLNDKLTINTDQAIELNSAGSTLLSFQSGGVATTYSVGSVIPSSVSTAAPGSLRYDQAAGDLFISRISPTNSTVWSKFITDVANAGTIFQNGNIDYGALVMGTNDNQPLSIITDGQAAIEIDTDQNVTVLNKLNVVEDLLVNGSSNKLTQLTVLGATTLAGDIALGSDFNDKVTLNSRLNSDLTFSGIAGNLINLVRSNPIDSDANPVDIQLTLPSQTGTLVAINALTNTVNLPGDLNLPNLLGILTVEGPTVLAANLTTTETSFNQSLQVNSAIDVPLTMATSNKQLFEFSPLNSVPNLFSSFGFYAENGPPVDPVTVGSLAVDTGAGQIYVRNQTSGWSRLITSSDEPPIRPGGNIGLANTLVMGSTDDNALELRTSNTLAMSFATNATATAGNEAVLFSDVALRGPLVVAKNGSFAQNYTVMGNSDLLNDAVIGTAGASELLINSAINDKLIFSSAAFTATLQTPSVAVAGIVNALPEYSGILAAMNTDSENEALLSGSLELTGQQTGASNLSVAGLTTLNSAVTVSGVNSAVSVAVGGDVPALSLTRTTDGSLAQFDFGPNGFDLYATSSAPTVLPIDLGSLAVDTASGDIYLSGAVRWQKLVTELEAVAHRGNRSLGTMTLGTTDSNSFLLGTNNGDANGVITNGITINSGDNNRVTLTNTATLTPGLTIQSAQGLTVLQGAANLENLTVSGTGNSTFSGKTIFNDTVEFNAVLNSSLPFKGRDVGNIEIVASNPALSSVLRMAGANGESGRLLVLEDATDRVNVTNLNIGGTQSVTSAATLNSAIIGGPTTITDDEAVEITAQTGSQILALNAPGSAFGLYLDPDAAATTSANTGSLAVDTVSGALSINSPAALTPTQPWVELLSPNTSGLVYVNGNNTTITTQLTIGSNDGEDVLIGTASTEAINSGIRIDGSNQAVTMSSGLSLASTLTVVGETAFTDAGADINFNESVRFASTTAETAFAADLIFGPTSAISTDLVFSDASSGNTTTLKPQLSVGLTTLNMPAFAGADTAWTLLTLGAGNNNDLNISGNVEANSAVVSGSVVSTGELSLLDGSLIAGSVSTNSAALVTETTGDVALQINSGNLDPIELSIYSSAATSIPSGVGSIAIDSSTGDMYMARPGNPALVWSKLIASTGTLEQLQGGNDFELTIGTLDARNVSLIVNSEPVITAGTDLNVTISKGLDVASGNLTVAAGSSSFDEGLSVNSTATLSGDTALGSDLSNTLSFNGSVNTDLVFTNPDGSSTILKRQSTASSIELDLPSQSGDLLVLDVNDDLSLINAIAITDDLNVTEDSVFTGTVTTNNQLKINANSPTEGGGLPISLKTSGEKLLNATSAAGSFGLYGVSGVPTVLTTLGSIAVDKSNGDVFVFKNTGWKKVATQNSNSVTLVGNTGLAGALTLGTQDGNSFSLGASSGAFNPVITIPSGTGAVSITGATSLPTGTLTVAGTTALQNFVADDAAVFSTGVIFAQPVSFGPTATINTDLKLQPVGSAGSVTLAKGASTANRSLQLPILPVSGTLISLDSSNDLSLLGNVQVVGQLSQTVAADTTTLTGLTQINKSLSVNSSTPTPLTPLALQTTDKQVLSLTGDGATVGVSLSNSAIVDGQNSSDSLGSLSVDVSNGELFITSSGAYQKLVDDGADDKVNVSTLLAATVSIGTIDGQDFELMSNSVAAVSVDGSSQEVSILKDLVVLGDSDLQQLTVSGASAFNSTINFNASVILSGAIGSNLTLSSSNGAGSITINQPAVDGNASSLMLPSQSGNLAVMEGSLLSVSGASTVLGQMEVSGSSSFDGSVAVSNGANISTTAGVPLIVNQSNGASNQIITLSSSSTDFTDFSIVRGTSASAGVGSLAVDVATGGIYQNVDGATGWTVFLKKNNDLVWVGGNATDSALILGNQSQGVEISTDSTSRMTLDGGIVTLNSDVNFENGIILSSVSGGDALISVGNNSTAIDVELPGREVTLLGVTTAGQLTSNIGLLSLVNTSNTTTPLTLTSAGDELISFTDKSSANFGLFAGTPASLGVKASGSITSSLAAGDLYVSNGAAWQRVLTESDLSPSFALVGGNTGPLVIGTTNSSILDLKTNNISALTIDSSQAVAIAKSLTVQEGLTVVGNVALGATDANSVTINGTITNDLKISADDGSAITLKRPLTGGAIVTLPSTSGTILTDNDNVTNIADNIVNTQHIVNGSIQFEDLDSGLTAQITSLGTLTGLDVSGASTLSTLNVTGSSTLASLTATEITATGASSLGSLTVSGASSLNTLSVSGVSALDSLTVTNASSLSSLSVTNASTLTGAVTTESDVSVGGNLTVAGTISGLIPAATSGVATLCIDNGVISTCSSLGALKTNATTLDMGMDTLMALQPKRFNWINGGREDLGFIAEEVEAVNPLLASYDDQGALIGVKYRHMTALLTKAVQEQQGQLENIDDTMDLSSGHMGIGTLAKNDFTLDVGGSIRATQFVESSDERLKTNVRSLQQGLGGSVLAKLSQIDGVFYDWNQTYRDLNPGVRIEGQVGVLAQQVESVLPHLVQTDSRGYKTVAYNKLTPYLIEGVNELDAKVQSIANSVTTVDNARVMNAESADFNKVSVQADELNKGLRIRRAKALSSLFRVGSEKHKDELVEGYISARDVYLSESDSWLSDSNSRVKVITEAPMEWECALNLNEGEMRFISELRKLYVCNGEQGWLQRSLFQAEG